MMARGRMIDLTLFTNEEFGLLKDGEKILYIGTIINADDEGRMKANPEILKAKIFPYDRKGPKRIKAMRDKLKEIGLIRVYKVNNKEYLDHPNWGKFQILRKDRLTPSIIPVCQPNDNQMVTKCQPDGNQITPEGKVSKVKISKNIPYKDIYTYLSNNQFLKTIKEAVVKDWLETYDLDYILTCLKEMNTYLLNNPQKRYKNYGRFATAWIKRSKQWQEEAKQKVEKERAEREKKEREKRIEEEERLEKMKKEATPIPKEAREALKKLAEKFEERKVKDKL